MSRKNGAVDKRPRNMSGAVTNRAYRNRQQTPANMAEAGETALQKPHIARRS